MRIQQVKKIAFKEHIIEKFVLRLDFQKLIKLDEFGARIKKLIGESFPDFDDKVEDQFLVNFTASGPEVTKKEHTSKTLVFMSSDKQRRIELGQSFFVYIDDSYTSFDLTMGRLDECFNILKNDSDIEPVKFTKVGIRKINSIVLPEKGVTQNFCTVFNSYLTGHLSSDLVSDGLIETFNQVILNEGNDRIIVKHGTQLGFIDKEGAGESARKFILDIDIIRESGQFEDVVEILKKNNDRIFDIFWWATTEEFRDKQLGVKQ